MKEVGLVLAPELVNWDVSAISGGAEQLHILQRRACFTELSATELVAHSAIFGPVAMSFDIARLRGAGATPVIYVPQGVEETALPANTAAPVLGSRSASGELAIDRLQWSGVQRRPFGFQAPIWPDQRPSFPWELPKCLAAGS
jgi:hypothetical protein